MKKIRGFEIAKGFEDKGINLPIRKTKGSAGYDFEVAEDVVVPKFEKGQKPTIIKTGVKAYMPEDEVLYLYGRSSFGYKYNITLANSVGVIDSDFYNNIDNEGHFKVKLINHGDTEVKINIGDRIAQGIFMKYLTVDDEEEIENERTGGIGSTNKEGK